MGKFDRSRNNKWRSSNWDRGDKKREMFKTVCSDCGKDCQVPFKPTSGKSVYCSDCFEKVSKSSSGWRNEKKGQRERLFFDKHKTFMTRPDTQLNDLIASVAVINGKLDKITEFLMPKKNENPTVQDIGLKLKSPKTKKEK